MKSTNFFKSACIFILSFIYLYLIRAQYVFISDEGIFSYGAIRILNGDILYKDFYERVSPGNYYLLVFLFKIFGINTTVTMFTTFTIFGLIAVVIYLISKEIKLSPIFTFLLIVFFIIDNPSKFMLFSHHWISTLWALISFLFFLRSSLFLSGFFSGLAITFFYPKGVTLTAGIVLMLLMLNSKIGKKNIIRDILFYLSGFILPILFFVIYFIAKDALSDFLYYWLIEPFRGYPLVHSYPSYYYPAKYYLVIAYQQKRLIHNFVISLPIFFLGYNFFISTGIFMSLFSLNKKKIFEEYGVYLKVFIITVFIFISCLYRPDDLRLAFISPFTYITFICALSMVTDYFKRRLKKKWRRAILYALALSIPIFGTTSNFISNIRFIFYAHNNYERIDTPAGGIFVDKRESAEVREFTRYLEEMKIKDIFIYHCVPSIYFIWSLNNPTKYNCLGPYYNRQEDLLDAVEQLRIKKTDYILFMPFYLYQKEQYYPVSKEIDFVELDNMDPILMYLREDFNPILQYRYVRNEGIIAKKTVEGYMVSLYKRMNK